MDFDRKDIIKGMFTNLSKISLENNKIFYSNALEFENICEEEYNNIDTIKQELEDKKIELDNLIQEQQDNIEYYKTLELNQKKIENEKTIIVENKKNLALIKDKLKQMKEELNKEKEIFEKEKKEFNQMKKQFYTNTIDMDEFLKTKPFFILF